MTEHIRAARELNVDAQRYITHHLHPGPGYDSAKVTKLDIVMALLRTIQAQDALLQALVNPEQERAEKADMATVYEVGFREGVQAGGGTV